MTPEERFQKIEEHLLVMAELARTNERRWDERFDQHDARLARQEKVVEALASGQRNMLRAMEKLGEKVSELANDEAVTRAMLQSLIQTADRFIRGRGGDGQ